MTRIKYRMNLLQLFVLSLVLVGPWIFNVVRLANCDFKEDFTCEAIHTIGLIIPPASYVTVWFPSD